MANIFLLDPVYITVQDVIDSTSNPAVASLTSDEIKILITKAQREVDAYLGRTFRPPFVDTQLLLFPVSNDGVSYLPIEITEATLYIVEQLFLLGDTVTASIPYETINSETIGPRSYDYGDNKTDRDGYMIPDIAIKLLKDFKNRFAGQYLGTNSSTRGRPL